MSLIGLHKTEDEVTTILRNVGKYLPNDSAFHTALRTPNLAPIASFMALGKTVFKDVSREGRHIVMLTSSYNVSTLKFAVLTTV